MAWLKIDDGLPSNRKWRRLVKRSPEAGCLWLAAGCYSARYLTDGLVPKKDLDDLVPFRQPERLAAICMEEGAFEDEGDAWFVHDYLDYNPSAEEIRAKQEADRERQARRRKAGSAAVGRGPNGQFVTPDDTRDTHRDNTRDGPRDNTRDARGVSRRASPAIVPSRPVPSSSSPNPLGDGGAPPDLAEEEEISGSNESLTDEDRQAVEGVSEGWLEWHRTRAEQGIREPITDSAAWLDTDRRRRLAALASGDRSVLDAPPAAIGGHRPDPMEASAAAQRAIAERNEARLRGEFSCGKCSDAGVFEREDGSVVRCECVGSVAKAAAQ